MWEVDRLSKADLSDFYQLYLYAFTNKDSEERRQFFDDRFNHSLAYGIRQDSSLGSGMLSIPMKVNFHGVKYKMNGICDVMSYPEFGGRGAITALMKSAFEDMLQEGVSLSYLAPFSYDFYRRFGYEEVFDRAEYQVKNTDLPRIRVESNDGVIKRLPLKDAIKLIKEVYDENIQTRNAGLVREDWWWNYLTLKHPDWMVGVYLENESAASYVIYEGSDETFHIQEMMYTNQASYQSIMSFICQHESMYFNFEYKSGDPNGYPDILNNPEAINVSIKPYMMARIIDLKKFVNDYPFVQKVHSIRIAIQDDMIAQNNGIWRLRVSSNGTSFEKLSNNYQNMADIRMSIQTATKVLMGYRNAMRQSRLGQINGSFEAINELDRALRKETPMLWDYF